MFNLFKTSLESLRLFLRHHRKTIKLKLLDRYYWHINLKRPGPVVKADPNRVNLNVGSNAIHIPDFQNLDLDTEHYHSKTGVRKPDFIEYDMRKDRLPYADDSVDNIYCAQVIEHVEDFAVWNLIKDAYRALKKGGCLRLVCPDAKMLYAVSQFDNDAWCFKFGVAHGHDPYECLVQHLATPRSDMNRQKIPEKVVALQDIKAMPYDVLMQRLREGLEFREKYPGEHINNWDFPRIRALGEEAGFEYIIHSAHASSVSYMMIKADLCSKFRPFSLYVDLVK